VKNVPGKRIVSIRTLGRRMLAYWNKERRLRPGAVAQAYKI
jgi:hypothetical protein